MNRALCNACGKLVPANDEARQGKVYLVKTCPDCGTTDTLISADAERYFNKRNLDVGIADKSCALNCIDCNHGIPPGLVFLDITNRCNMNCPICINNTPSMGFTFEPPMSYFEKIFAHLATLRPSPSVQLFGGEPTVRKDLFDIIALARRYKLRPRVVTNGLKLADEEYCRKLVETKVKILLAYDGANPELYRNVRGTPKALELKLKAIDNVKKAGQGRLILMTLISRDYNAQELPDLVRFCHDRRDFIKAMYLMPLAHTWDSNQWEYSPEQMTSEDVEKAVDDAFPGDRVEFLPAGFTGQLTALRRCLRIKALPFQGIHPNCESVFLMVSNGEEYVPLTRFLTVSPIQAVQSLIDANKVLEKKVEKLDNSFFGKLLTLLHLKEPWLYLMGVRCAWSVLRRNVRITAHIKGKGVGKVYHAGMALLERVFGRSSNEVRQRHTNLHEVLDILVLPFEDDSNIETDRMKRCTSAFAFVDPDSDEVKTVPLCAWWSFKNDVMKKLVARFGAGKADTAAQE